MSNYLYIPILNPVHFVEIAPVESAQYLSRSMDDYVFSKTLQAWEEKMGYCQKVQKSDTTYLQFLSNFSPIQVDVINAAGRLFLTQNATQKLQNKFQPGYYAF